MLLSIGAALDSERGTVVQKAEAHRAALLHPDEMPVAHLNRVDGAFLGTKAAPDARIFNRERAGKAAFLVVEAFAEDSGEIRCGLVGVPPRIALVSIER